MKMQLKQAQAVAPYNMAQQHADERIHCRLHVYAGFLLQNSFQMVHLGMQLLLTAPQAGQAPL